MDVSRINPLAPSPRHMDWRKLTANEIIKYDNEGIYVPEQYLQWAKEFLQDVTAQDKDETTYEMANSSISADKKSAPTQENPTGETKQEPPAKEKREQMEKNGASTWKIAKTFRKESKERTQESNIGANITSEISNTSENEIQTVEGRMQELLADADNIKDKINSEKSKKDSTSTAGKVLELQNQLKRIGKEAQSLLSNSEVDINDYQAIVDIQAPIGRTTTEYGTETVGLGKQLKGIPLIGHIVGKHTEAIGNRAIGAGENLSEIASTTTESNEANLNKISNYKTEVQSKTGIGEVKPENDKMENEDTNKNDPANNASITETDKAASANLEQVLLAKIRRGENPNG